MLATRLTRAVSFAYLVFSIVCHTVIRRVLELCDRRRTPIDGDNGTFWCKLRPTPIRGVAERLVQ